MLVVSGLVGQRVRYPIIGHSLITAPCCLQFSVPLSLIGLVSPASKSTVILQLRLGFPRYLPLFSKTVKSHPTNRSGEEKREGKERKILEDYPPTFSPFCTPILAVLGFAASFFFVLQSWREFSIYLTDCSYSGRWHGLPCTQLQPHPAKPVIFASNFIFLSWRYVLLFHASKKSPLFLSQFSFGKIEISTSPPPRRRCTVSQ